MAIAYQARATQTNNDVVGNTLGIVPTFVAATLNPWTWPEQAIFVGIEFASTVPGGTVTSVECRDTDGVTVLATLRRLAAYDSPSTLSSQYLYFMSEAQLTPLGPTRAARFYATHTFGDFDPNFGVSMYYVLFSGVPQNNHPVIVTGSALASPLVLPSIVTPHGGLIINQFAGTWRPGAPYFQDQLTSWGEVHQTQLLQTQGWAGRNAGSVILRPGSFSTTLAGPATFTPTWTDSGALPGFGSVGKVAGLSVFWSELPDPIINPCLIGSNF